MNGFATAEPKAPPKVMAKYALDYVHYREVPERTPVNVLLWQLRRHEVHKAEAAAAPAGPKPDPAAASASSSSTAPPPVQERHCRDYVHYRNEPAKEPEFVTFDELLARVFQKSKRKGPGVSL